MKTLTMAIIVLAVSVGVGSTAKTRMSHNTYAQAQQSYDQEPPNGQSMKQKREHWRKWSRT
ncbi:MAG TPA: hypothetical protein VGJ20_20500 [Xanthobacteraceae bacterium]